MRGKEVQGLLQELVGGITPACAGKSGHGCRLCIALEDHPRVCGEKDKTSVELAPGAGSPPRVRGKEDSGENPCFGVGITPACAGKSVHHRGRGQQPEDHPRLCGEKAA